MQIDWWTLALQTVNFLIVVWLLGRFLFRPIRRIIDEREAADRVAAEAAQARSDAADAMRAAYEAKLADLAARDAAREAELAAQLDRERSAKLQAAEAEAAGIVTRARARIAREETQALGKLTGQVAALAADLARAALAPAAAGGDDLPAVMAHLRGLPAADVDDLRHDLKAAGSTVRIVTPAAADDATRAAWRRALADWLGGDPAIAFQADPGILGGVELHFPHAVLRFSVADRLDRAVKGLEG